MFFMPKSKSGIIGIFLTLFGITGFILLPLINISNRLEISNYLNLSSWIFWTIGVIGFLIYIISISVNSSKNMRKMEGRRIPVFINRGIAFFIDIFMITTIIIVYIFIFEEEINTGDSSIYLNILILLFSL